MPQASASTTPSPSSLSQSQGFPQIQGCRWAWCRLTFFSNSELVQHVIHDHVRRAVPVRRKDIPILRRAEEGIGESLSLSGFGISYPLREDERSGSKIRPEVELPSSLPSPPASSPTSISHAVPDQHDDGHSHPASPNLLFGQSPSSEDPHAFDRHSPFRSRIAAAKSPSRSITPTTPQPEQARDTGTPTFASLSSPLSSPSPIISDIPPTPSFNAMVDNAIGSNLKRRRNNDSPAECHTESWSGFSQHSDSQDSQSSSGSHDLVERQLTQSMDMDVDSPARTSGAKFAPSPAPRLQRQPPAPLSISPAQKISVHDAGSPSPSIATPIGIRQAWYGTLPTKRPRKVASPIVGAGQSIPRKRSGLHASQFIPSSQSNGHPFTTGREGHAARSDNLQLTPVASPLDRGDFADPYSQDHSPASSQAHSETQDSSLDYLSYPPLQTQAPYHSQSFSQ